MFLSDSWLFDVFFLCASYFVIYRAMSMRGQPARQWKSLFWAVAERGPSRAWREVGRSEWSGRWSPVSAYVLVPIATCCLQYLFGGTYPLYPYLCLSVATCSLQYWFGVRQVSLRAAFGIGLVARTPHIHICVLVSSRAVFSIGLVTSILRIRICVLVSPCAIFSIFLVSRQVSPRVAFGIGLVVFIPRIHIWECRHLLCRDLSVSGVNRVRISAVRRHQSSVYRVRISAVRRHQSSVSRFRSLCVLLTI